MPNTNSNQYTITYAVVMTLLVAIALATVATSLKPLQEKEESLDKKKQIISSVTPIEDKSVVEEKYQKHITEMVIDHSGNKVDGATAFDIDLRKEYRKDAADRQLPLYIYKGDDGKQNYIMPLHGAGLWDEIWGFISLDSDFNTIAGASFDHKGETPGLGAEITRSWFQDQFQNKKLTNNGTYAFDILKGRGNEIEGKIHLVDGMSGATITGDGVEAMMEKAYGAYAAFFKKKGGA